MQTKSITFCAIIAHVAVHKIVKLQRQLTFLSTRDSMTGALNREQLEQRLQQALHDKKTGKKASIAMIDVDHFKKVNDIYGHDVGDDVIKQIVAIIHHNTRKQDRLFRLGGDEFLLLFEGVSDQTAQCMITLISNKIRTQCFLQHAQISLSIGVSECLAHEDSPQRWLKRADVALYAAKKNGRDQVYVASHTPEPVKRKA